jgi:arylsulfatase A-like enzyme
MNRPDVKPIKSRLDVVLLIALAAALIEGIAAAVIYRQLPVGPVRFFTAAISGYAALMALGGGMLTWLLTLLFRRPRPAAALGSALAWFALFSWRGFGLTTLLETGPITTKDVAATPVWPVYTIAGSAALAVGLMAWLLATRKQRWIPKPMAVTLVLLVLAGGIFFTRGGSPAPTGPVETSTVVGPEASPLFDSDGTNLLLITVDTLRADHTSAYGYSRETSPTLAELTGRGVRFERCITQRTNTAASVATLMTGLYPPTNRTLNNRDILQDFNVTMAEQFRDKGFRTAAFVTVPVVGPRFNFDQGFDQFKMLAFRIPEDELAESRIVNRSAFNWLTANAGERFFLWLHYKDPHSPYLVPHKYKGLYLDDPGVAPPDETEMLTLGPMEKRRENARYFISQYDAEIRFIDDNLNLLFEKLDELGLLDHTLVVLTADHGEELGEHGEYFAHGRNCYEPTAHVPLYFIHPELPQGLLVTDPVSLVDVLPTLRELFGFGIDPAHQGLSLGPQLAGDPHHSPHPYHFTIGNYRYGYQTHSVTTSRHKLIMTVKQGLVATDRAMEELLRVWTGGPLSNPYRSRVVVYELYDLETDPGEMNDLAGNGLSAETELKDALWRWMDQTYLRGSAHDIRQGDLTPRLADQLRALGYLEK